MCCCAGNLCNVSTLPERLALFAIIIYYLLFAILETRRGLEPKCFGQFFFLSLETVPEVFAKVDSPQFPSRF